MYACIHTGIYTHRACQKSDPLPSSPLFSQKTHENFGKWQKKGVSKEISFGGKVFGTREDNFKI